MSSQIKRIPIKDLLQKWGPENPQSLQPQTNGFHEPPANVATSSALNCNDHESYSAFGNCNGQFSGPSPFEVETPHPSTNCDMLAREFSNSTPQVSILSSLQKSDSEDSLLAALMSEDPLKNEPTQAPGNSFSPQPQSGPLPAFNPLPQSTQSPIFICNDPTLAPGYNQPVSVPSQGFNQPVLVPSQGYNQPVSIPSQGFNQPVSVPSQGFNQPVSVPSQGFNQPVSIPSQGYNQPVPGTSQGFNQPGPGPLQGFSQPVRGPSQPDALLAAAAAAGLLKPDPKVEFVVQPDDVQFRYDKEWKGGHTSPIRAEESPNKRKFPVVKISNVPHDEALKLQLALVDKNMKTSIHNFYKTNKLRGGDLQLEFEITRDQDFELEHYGISRGTPKKGDDKDIHNSVVICVRLLRSDGRLIEGGGVCFSKLILDQKKINLNIVHANPLRGFNSATSRNEMTILCSKISKDTEVQFEVDGVVRNAEILLRHHGVALVVRPPLFEHRSLDSFQARVRLFNPIYQRYSDPKLYEYQIDPVDSLYTTLARPSRERSPLRTDSQFEPVQFESQSLTNSDSPLEFDSPLESDGLSASMERLTLDSRKIINKCLQQRVTLLVKMADLKKIRDVASGREGWTEEAEELLRSSPYILHVQDSEGFTPPMRALLSDRPQVFEKFLASVNDSEKERLLTSRTCGGATVLHLLAIPASVPRSLLELTLKTGAEPGRGDDGGQTVVHWLVRKQRVELLRSAIESFEQLFRQREDQPKATAALQELLDRLDNSGQAAIHCAVLSSNIGAIDVLATFGASMNLRSPNSGFSPLHWAIIENNTQAVRALIARKADVHLETNWGATPLDVAQQSSETHSDILQELRKAGASRGSVGSSEEED